MAPHHVPGSVQQVTSGTPPLVWHVVGGTLGLFVLIWIVSAFLPGSRLRRRSRRVARAKSTITAPAEVLRIGEVVEILNSVQRRRLFLRVQPSGTAPFEAQAQALMDPTVAPQLQPGCTVQVQYDPAQPDVVEIVDPTAESRVSKPSGWGIRVH